MFTEWSGHKGAGQRAVGVDGSEDVAVEVWKTKGGSTGGLGVWCNGNEDVAREREVFLLN